MEEGEGVGEGDRGEETLKRKERKSSLLLCIPEPWEKS